MNLLCADEDLSPAARRALDIGVLVRCTSDLLAAGVPLTLLLDLAEADGPRSSRWYELEGGDASWVVPGPRR